MLLRRPLFYFGGHYIMVLGLIGFIVGIEIANPQRGVRTRSGTLKVGNVTKRENTEALEATL